MSTHKPLPPWWNDLPLSENSAQLQATVPFVHARLHRAAEFIVEGDRLAERGEKRRPEHEHPLVDAFHDLQLPGTNFTSTPQAETIFRSYQDICNKLRFPELF